MTETTVGQAPPVEEERTYFDNSGLNYVQFMKTVRRHFNVKSYFEVGTFSGGSLADVTCDTVSVDPKFKLDRDVIGDKQALMMFQMTSDDFFGKYDLSALLGGPVDMAFLDGLHIYEYLFRDFINTERHMKPNGVVFLHDCLPRTFGITARRQGEAKGRGWTGDVWKVVAILKKYRPDLQVHLLNCPPTGLVMISNMDPTSTVLEDRYYEITREFAESDNDEKLFTEYFDSVDALDSLKYRDFSELTKLIWI